MNPRCEFYWVVRTDFWLSREHADYIVSRALAYQAKVKELIEHTSTCETCGVDLCEEGQALQADCAKPSHQYVSVVAFRFHFHEPSKPMTLDVDHVAGLVDLLGDSLEHPMLKEIFTAALKFMREHAERR